jgi:hypothetical protein
MKRILALCLAATLPACAALNAPLPAPAAIADRTVLDEKAALGVELAYQAANLAALTASRAGLISDEARPRIAAADARAYAAVLAVRQAYDAGNGGSYFETEARARAALAEFLALIK